MIKAIISFSILLLPSVAMAAFSEVDLQDIMVRLSGLLGPLMRLLLTISFISGIVFTLRGLLMLKAFSMPLTQASKPGEISGPLVYIFVGTILIYIPTSTDVLSATLFGSGPSIFSGGKGSGDSFTNLGNMGKASDKLLGYAPVSIEGQWAVMVDTIVLYMEFIGFLAFLRGWFLIAQSGQPGVQPGSISKGIIHVVGGLLAINFLPLVKAIRGTLGL
jgi:intracellular multiplication protein IcmC